MDIGENLERLILSAHVLTRIAAQESGNDAPSAQWRALAALRDGGELRIGELARRARTTQPGMTRLAAQLEAHGLVVRSDDPLDSRATVARITPAGADALVSWTTQLRETLAPRFVDLDDEDAATIARAATLLAARTRLEPVR